MITCWSPGNKSAESRHLADQLGVQRFEILAHEVTHHFQRSVRMTPAQTPNEQIRYENQADCGAGAFMSYAEKRGRLDRADDLRDLAGSLTAAGEAESDQQSHGTIRERLAAFDRAFLGSWDPPLVACNTFVPEKPIITRS